MEAEGVVNKQSTAAHADLTRIYDAWLAWVAKPPTKGKVLVLLAAERDKVKEELLDLEIRVEGLLKPENNAELKKVVEEAKKVDAAQAKAKRPAAVARLLDELEKFEVNVQEDRQKYQTFVAAGSAGEGGLAALEGQLQKTLDEARKKHAEKQEKYRKNLDEINKALRQFKGNNALFKPYIDELRTQSADIRAMIDSGDPYLFKLAVEEREALVERMREIDPKYQAEGKTFDDVDKQWKAISNLLSKDDLVKKRLPDTYQRLYRQLTEAIALAQRSGPQDGLKALEPLATEVEKARAAAGAVDQFHKQFLEKKKAVEARWDEITKQTWASMTDRTRAYEAKLKTLLADAEATAGQEGKIHDAFNKLAALETDLKKIASDPNPGQALQDEGVKAVKEQQAVADMARQFEAALGAYQKKTLPELRKALKEVDGADLDQVAMLEKVGDRARLIVEPYLILLSQSLFKKANPSPLMDKAKADFAQANRMLTDATRTAQRVAAGPEGTNVNVAADLAKVAAEWLKQANAYAAAVKSLDQAIQAASKDDEEAAVLDAVKTVSADLADVAKRFRPDAFAAPMKTLSDGKADADKKLAAREEALRDVRRFTEALLNDPVMVKINDPKNPFLNINKETSLLLAALKKLKLAVLVGV
jgi:hypothetical protein